MQRGGAHRCGAAIIAPTCILTAAHCTDGLQAATLSIRAGSTSSAIGGQIAHVSAVHPHPKFDKRTFHNDLCVLWLSGTLDTRPAAVRVVAMPAFQQPLRAGDYASVAGWGHEKEQGNVNSPHLRAVSVPIVEQALCRQWYKGVSIIDGMLCAGYATGAKDACQNDSGGPLTLDGLLVGIVSWGNGCARPKQPGVYARVAYYRDWIDAKVSAGGRQKAAPVKRTRGWQPFYFNQW